MKLSEFDFLLPKEQIAQHPLPERDKSRMLVVDREKQTWEHRLFCELPDLLGPEHFLVLNTTKVIPARLRAHRPGRRESIEVLLAKKEDSGEWLALVKPGRKCPRGQELVVGNHHMRVSQVRPDGARMLQTDNPERFMDIMESEGEPPLPPYIERNPGEELALDRERYQTVYARQSGSIAAPTAGLHFTPEVLERLQQRGIQTYEILLHVGFGTFQPVRCLEIEDHKLEPEYFEISDSAATSICRGKQNGGKLVAVGTTTTRVLENWARIGYPSPKGLSGFCGLFIYPEFEFRILDGLLTNFHLPRSTLFVLVSAFAGREFMLSCYEEAIREGYRFFSYGDCMLIL